MPTPLLRMIFAATILAGVSVALPGCAYDPYSGTYVPYAYPTYGYYAYPGYGYYPAPVYGSVEIGGWFGGGYRGWGGDRRWGGYHHWHH